MAALVRYSTGGRTLQNQNGETGEVTFRVLTFCSHQQELKGIERDRKGLTGTEIVGVLGKDLVFTGLSSPSHGGDRGSKPLGTASFQSRFSIATAHFPPSLFPRFFCRVDIVCLPPGRSYGHEARFKTVASDQNRNENRVSRPEVICSCGLCLPLGPTLQRRFRVRASKTFWLKAGQTVRYA